MKLMSIAETAKCLSVSTMSVRRWIKSGKLQHVRLGRSVRVPSTSVDQFVKQNTQDWQ